MFEAAPDPRNKALKARWDALSASDKQGISKTVINEIMPKVADAVGVGIQVSEQIGGWMDSTNPSFTAQFPEGTDPGKFIEAMKMSGFALSQEGMMGISETELPGSQKAGFISVPVEDGQDVGVRERRNRARLLLEAMQPRRVGCESSG